MQASRTRQMKEDVARHVDDMRESMCELSDRIHDHPELGLEEHKAADWHASALRERGFSVDTGLGGLETAFRATYGIGKGTPVACLIVEYDALPVLGHACGHNVSGVSSLAAAIALSKTMETYSLDGTLAVVGTPAEESCAGKVTLIKAGVFNDADFSMMVHMYHRNEARPVFLALDAPTFSFTGKASHAAGAPHLGVNALNGVRLTFAGIDALRQHVRDDVRIHGVITEGGDAPNVVPERASANIFVRALDRAYLDRVAESVENCARGAALATGATLEISSFEQSTDDLRTHDALIEVFKENWKSFASEIEESGSAVGSTDMGNVSHVVPSIHPMMAMAPAETPLHTREFAEAAKSQQAHEALVVAAKTMAMTVIDLLADPGLIGLATD